MINESVRDFILKEEQNLRIAVAVSEAWPGVRDHITTTFLDRLGAKLLSDLPGWNFGTCDRFFVDEWATASVWKPSWQDQYWVTLQAYEFGGNILFGIHRNNDLSMIESRPLSRELLTAVRAVQPSARSKKWWDAQLSMRIPASDWRTPDVLWRMYADELFLKEVAEQMVSVARASESILDELTKAGAT